MAVDLDDGEFWLPSQFLTEEDILTDFGGGENIGANSDLNSPVESVTETESDEDEFFAELTRRMSRTSIAAPKGLVLSGSPQSTLFPVGGGSSRGSPTGPVSPPPTKEMCFKAAESASFDLLNAAAGEVAKLRTRFDEPQPKGTGFFDPSRGFPTPPVKLPASPVPLGPAFHGFYPLKPELTRRQTAYQFPQVWNNRPLGLSPAAWPPLQRPLNRQPHPQPPLKRESVGTGVFLPRRVTPTPAANPNPHPADSRKIKNKNDSTGRFRSQSKRENAHRPLSGPNSTEIRLPSEWTY